MSCDKAFASEPTRTPKTHSSCWGTPTTAFRRTCELHSWQSHGQKLGQINQRYISLRKLVTTSLTLASRRRLSLDLRTLFVALPQNRFEARFSTTKKGHPAVSHFVAENQRFELWNRVTGYTISNRAPSTN